MAFPASKKDASFEKAWNQFCEAADGAKARATGLSDKSLTEITPRTRYRAVREELDNALGEWARIIADYPGLQAWVRNNVEGLAAIDLATEYVAMRNATRDLRDWINNNMPVDAETGAALEHLPDGTPLTVPTTGPVIEDFRANVATFAATID